MQQSSLQHRARRAGAALVSLAFGACAPAAPSADASAQDASSDRSVMTQADAVVDGATDAATSCEDVTGAWEWTGTCSDPRINVTPTACLTQSSCVVQGWPGGPATVAGNVLTQRYTVARGGVDAVETVTFNGDVATLSVTITAPVRATCMGTGRRVTFPGATSYCCDVARSTCGAGQRCAPVAVGTSNFIATACLPEGSTPLGGMCTRVMDRLGTDTCAGQAVCANLGQSATTSRVCAKTCSNASDCDANQICRQLGAEPQNGVCRPRCSLFGSDCQAAATCRPVVAWGAASDRSIRWEPHCEFSGPRAEGMACRDSFECAADHWCIPGAEGGVCRRACDRTHACPATLRCEAIPVEAGVENETGLGACLPM